MTQLELFTNSWGINSGFKHIQEQLNDKLPLMGKVEKSKSTNKQLEKFRVAQNLLHDLFNNGLMNRRTHFKRFFGFVPINTNGHVSAERWDQVDNEMEGYMTKIMLDAATEQGIN